MTCFDQEVFTQLVLAGGSLPYSLTGNNKNTVLVCVMHPRRSSSTGAAFENTSRCQPPAHHSEARRDVYGTPYFDTKRFCNCTNERKERNSSNPPLAGATTSLHHRRLPTFKDSLNFCQICLAETVPWRPTRSPPLNLTLRLLPQLTRWQEAIKCPSSLMGHFALKTVRLDQLSSTQSRMGIDISI